MSSRDPFRSAAPRALRDPEALTARLSAVRTEPRVHPLNDWVEKLRVRLGDGESVPWFDRIAAPGRSEIRRAAPFLHEVIGMLPARRSRTSCGRPPACWGAGDGDRTAGPA
ncbi:hypothetical protein [Streptomyces sp. Amel2xC10]|uniref:hypothetical protein n=1 Tax=Streptomyces sp. Amel2xC10 TaxID=1305826 RepID=UPI000A085B9D|nr:hypothetical protein [Streptomyces sp. Amel2xC10]SME89187.1 hypothetical protein SAMN02745830_00175 [Streptomyces sp. Amel2xC10]